MNVNIIKKNAIICAQKMCFKLKKRSPELLITAGFVSVVGGTIVACKGTLKVKELVDEHHELKHEIDEAVACGRVDKDGNVYTENDAKADKRIITARLVLNCVKYYAPAAGLLILGMFCVCKSHSIMSARLNAAISAYNGLKVTFDAYRDNVKEHISEEKEKDILNDTLHECSAYNSKYVLNSRCAMPSVLWDAGNAEWTTSAFHNKCYYVTQINQLNRLLRERGYVFLNEAYEAFGIPVTAEGQYLGWTSEIPETDGKDAFISMGPNAENFVNEVENGEWDNICAPGILFYPNVHGNILAYI